MKKPIFALFPSLFLIATQAGAQDAPLPPIPPPLEEPEGESPPKGSEGTETQPEEPAEEPPTEPVEPAADAGAPPTATLPPAPPADPPPASAQPVPRPSQPATASPQEPPPSSQPADQPSPSSPPPASAPPNEDDEASSEEGDTGGLYIDGNLALTYGLKSTHGWNDADNCPSASDLGWEPECPPASVPIGFAPEGRLGVRIHNLGIEGFLLGSFDWSSAQLEGGEPIAALPDFATNMQIVRAGGGLGLNLRAMSNGWVRFTAGAGGGVMFRRIFTNVSSLDGSSVGYTAPIIRADLSMSIGKFFNLGILGWVEFAPEVKVTPNLEGALGAAGVDTGTAEANTLLTQVETLQTAFGDVTVFDGPQFFIGPFLGIHLGK